MKHLIISILLFFILQPLSSAEPPKHEIRAVWLTTIYGLDWPKRVASGTESRLVQQRELCQLLDQLQDAHFNTVFLQVRLRCYFVRNYEFVGLDFLEAGDAQPLRSEERRVGKECYD